jgi:hypothetical protein
MGQSAETEHIQVYVCYIHIIYLVLVNYLLTLNSINCVCFILWKSQLQCKDVHTKNFFFFRYLKWCSLILMNKTLVRQYAQQILLRTVTINYIIINLWTERVSTQNIFIVTHYPILCYFRQTSDCNVSQTVWMEWYRQPILW